MKNKEYAIIAEDYEANHSKYDSPIKFCYNYTNKKDIEIVGIISSWLAYGDICSYTNKTYCLIKNIIGEEPYNYIISGSWAKYKDDYSCLYRVTTWHNFSVLCEKLRFVYLNYKDLEDATLTNFKDRKNKYKYYFQSLCGLLGGETMMQTNESCGTNKRINLFLMWMIRKDSKNELGIWKSLKQEHLLIPCDTQLLLVAKKLGIIDKVDENISTVINLTNFAKKVFSEDPTKIYYTLCGILKDKDYVHRI